MRKIIITIVTVSLMAGFASNVTRAESKQQEIQDLYDNENFAKRVPYVENTSRAVDEDKQDAEDLADARKAFNHFMNSWDNQSKVDIKINDTVMKDYKG